MADNDSRAAMGAAPKTSPDMVPPPLPPKPPVEGECCERGCEMCMWDYYREAQRRHEAALARWRERHGDPSGPTTGRGR